MKPFMAGCAVGCGTLLLVAVVVGSLPSESYEATDGIIKVHRMPLWEKMARFYLRHVELERMAREAAGGETDPQRRVLKLMNWTRETVRPVPAGLPSIDDHISHVVLRRYGDDGQLAEVFTSLTTYMGHFGRWSWHAPPGAKRSVVLSFVESDSGWWVFDVRNGGWFETEQGAIATIEDFKHPEKLTRRGHAPEVLEGTPYPAYYQNLEEVGKRSFSRASGQMPWYRLVMTLAPFSP